MGYRSTYNRRLRAIKRLQKRVAAGALLGVGVCATVFLMLREPVPVSARAEADGAPARQAGQSVAAAAVPGTHAGARRVYPYSVVPGGLAGREEMVHVLRTDQVVAQHYAGLQVAKVSAITVSKPRAVYVSYRKGDKVYWTSKKVMLAEGETLLSDGSNEIRTRCGNRISDVPRLPVAAGEPSAHMLDTAMTVDADEADDDARQANTASASAGGDGAPATVPTPYQPGNAYGSGLAPAYARPSARLALLGMAGMAGGTASSIRPGSPMSLAPVVGTGTGAASDSTVSSGTPGAPPAGTAGSGAGTVPGTGSGSGDTGSSSGTPGTGTGTSGTGTGTGTGGTGGAAGSDPVGGGTLAALPPLPESLSQPDALPVTQGQAPLKGSPLPEPDSLWLSGIALAAIVLRRRKPRPKRGT